MALLWHFNKKIMTFAAVHLLQRLPVHILPPLLAEFHGGVVVGIVLRPAKGAQPARIRRVGVGGQSQRLRQQPLRRLGGECGGRLRIHEAKMLLSRLLAMLTSADQNRQTETPLRLGERQEEEEVRAADGTLMRR